MNYISYTMPDMCSTMPDMCYFTSYTSPDRYYTSPLTVLQLAPAFEPLGGHP